jgi:hypothetical protein
MPEDSDQNLALARAREAFESGNIGSLTVCQSGRVGNPVPVRSPDGGLHSWFVPVIVGDLLAGFIEYQPDLTLVRYSSFQRREESMEGCPAAALWLDTTVIQSQLKSSVRPGEKVRETFLTYDTAPSHLAWAVVVESPDGTTRTLHVAGSTVWEAAGR